MSDGKVLTQDIKESVDKASPVAIEPVPHLSFSSSYLIVLIMLVGDV